MGHGNGQSEGENNHSEKSENKGERIQKRAENKERGEAANHISNGELNKDIAAKTLEKRLSRKSGATGYGVASADSLLPEEARAQRLEQRERNYHRDIAAQIKHAMKHGFEEKPHQGSEQGKTGKEHVEAKESQAKHDENPLEGGAKAVVNGVWNGIVGTGEALNRHANTVHISEGTGMDNISGVVHHPDAYKEYFRKESLNLGACEDAYKAFGLDRLGIDKNLVAGLVWNEQLHRKPVVDDTQDLAAGWGVHQAKTESVGPGQMQLRNIDALAEKYPQLKKLGEPEKAALQADKAPYFVAAYLLNEAEKIGAFNKQHSGEAGFKPVPVNTDSLAYRYNPDVYKDQSGNYRSLEPWEKLAIKANQLHGIKQMDFPVPGVVEHSHHVRKVHEAMKEIAEHK